MGERYADIYTANLKNISVLYLDWILRSSKSYLCGFYLHPVKSKSSVNPIIFLIHHKDVVREENQNFG